MKLERINDAAQIEFPNASPLNRSQRVSNMSAPIPDRKRMAEKIVTGALPATLRACGPRETCDSGAGRDLFIIAKTGGNPQNNSARDPGQKRPGENT